MLFTGIISIKNETMNKRSDRRKFLKQSSKFCLACGAFALCPNLNAFSQKSFGEDIPDPEKLNYCGYACPPDCPMFLATIENNAEKKKEVYEMWEIEDRYGLEFDQKQVFCYGCKIEDKPLGVVVENCPVRECAIEKSFECCIECSELQACEKDLWKKFPEFHKAVIEMQIKYNEANAGA
jgi:hypothetical protein